MYFRNWILVLLNTKLHFLRLSSLPWSSLVVFIGTFSEREKDFGTRKSDAEAGFYIGGPSKFMTASPDH